jgi:short/branched chain acyl-CoA dehydrogenase
MQISSFCLSESESGSDAFALKTTAEEQPDGSYLLNGSKMWISNAAEAELFLVFANAAPEKGYRGISCFLVERQWGVQVGKKESKLGLRASSTCQLTFDAVRVPKGNVVGRVGEGYKYAIGILNEGRIGIAAQMVGLAQGVFDKTLAFIYDGSEANKTLATSQVFHLQAAQAATEIEAARLLTYSAAKLKEQQQPVIKEASMAKLYASQIAERTSSLCVDWMGRLGLSNESHAQKMYRDSKIGSIYEGTSNIQLTTIAKQICREIDTQ